MEPVKFTYNLKAMNKEEICPKCKLTEKDCEHYEYWDQDPLNDFFELVDKLSDERKEKKL